MKGRITYIIINIDPFAARKGNLEVTYAQKNNDNNNYNNNFNHISQLIFLTNSSLLHSVLENRRFI